MKTLAFVIYMHLCVLAHAENAANPNPVAIMDFKETVDGRALAQRSTALANDIMRSVSSLRVIGSWQPKPPNSDDAELVRVYLVAPTSNNDDFSVMVPYNCNCIFVQPAVFEKRVSPYAKASPTMMAIDHGEALAFMILHEMGHIERGDPGKYQSKLKPHSYNFDRTDQKEVERLADKFAADGLVAAANDKANFAGWMASMKIQMTLSKISWNLSSLRLIDNFGASSLCSKFVFADDGFSHPNYELRILTVNDLLVRTDGSKELLQSFEACRR